MTSIALYSSNGDTAYIGREGGTTWWALRPEVTEDGYTFTDDADSILAGRDVIEWTGIDQEEFDPTTSPATFPLEATYEDGKVTMHRDPEQSRLTAYIYG